MADDRIGILGSGDVGRALGAGFARHGWDVQLGTRHVERLDSWRDETPGTVAVESFAQAASHGDVAVLAVDGAAVDDVLDLAGEASFTGTLLLDTTNPLEFVENGPPRLLLGGTDSLGERIQARLPDATIVKCFNTVNHGQMVDPAFEQGAPPMLICGNDAAAKERTEAILMELGWPGALDVGDIEAARYLEALVPLWVRVGSVLGTWDHAFAVVE